MKKSKMSKATLAKSVALTIAFAAGSYHYAAVPAGATQLSALHKAQYLAFGTSDSVGTYDYFYRASDGYKDISKDNSGYYYGSGQSKTYVDEKDVIKFKVQSVTLPDGSTSKYYVREGYGVKTTPGAYYDGAKMAYKFEAYSASGAPNTVDMVIAGRTNGSLIKEGTVEVETAINGDKLQTYKYGTYVGMNNNGTTSTTDVMHYMIERNGTYVNVGGNNSGGSQLNSNFWDVNYDSTTGTYYLKGDNSKKVVDFNYIYRIGTRVGVFTKQALTGSETTISQDQIYTGFVYGENNEIFITGRDKDSGEWTSMWAAANTDPQATIESMRISEFQEIIDGLSSNDNKLLNADIDKLKLNGSTNDANITL